MSTDNIWAAMKGAAAAGILAGGYPYAPNFWYMTGGDQSAPTFGKRVGTFAELFAIAQPGDVALIGPGFYAEGNLVIPATLTNFTIIGTGGRGAAGVEAPTGKAGIQVLADDVTFINFGVASSATGAYAVKIGSQTVSPARFRAYGCKFEGCETVNPAGQLVLSGCGDVIIDDCEFAWGANGIIGDGNDDGFPTEIYIRNCWFHDLTTVHIGVVVGDIFAGLYVKNNFFARDEAGVSPTDFILLSGNGNFGAITNNQFANATNATGVITIGTGLLYMANATEAGWSTARPA